MNSLKAYELRRFYNTKFTDKSLQLMSSVKEWSFAVGSTYQIVQANIIKVALVFSVQRLSNTLQPKYTYQLAKHSLHFLLSHHKSHYDT